MHEAPGKSKLPSEDKKETSVFWTESNHVPTKFKLGVLQKFLLEDEKFESLGFPGVELPWKFLANIDCGSHLAPRRTMALVYAHIHPSCPINLRETYHWANLNKDYQNEVKRIVGESNNNHLLGLMTQWWCRHYSSDEATVIMATKVLREAASFAVRNPALYEMEYYKAYDKWIRFMDAGGLDAKPLKLQEVEETSDDYDVEVDGYGMESEEDEDMGPNSSGSDDFIVQDDAYESDEPLDLINAASAERYRRHEARNTLQTRRKPRFSYDFEQKDAKTKHTGPKVDSHPCSKSAVETGLESNAKSVASSSSDEPAWNRIAEVTIFPERTTRRGTRFATSGQETWENIPKPIMASAVVDDDTYTAPSISSMSLPKKPKPKPRRGRYNKMAVLDTETDEDEKEESEVLEDDFNPSFTALTLGEDLPKERLPKKRPAMSPIKATPSMKRQMKKGNTNVRKVNSAYARRWDD